MATLAQNQAELAAGLREIAGELGSVCTLYRSAAVPLVSGAYATPIDDAYIITLTKASFPCNYTYRLSVDPLKPQRFGVVDPDIVQPGDYLVRVNDGEIHFIANMEPFTPISAVLCNRRVSVRRQSDVSRAAPNRVGAVGQLGNVTVGSNANVPTVLAGWPASVLYSGRGGKPLSGLPADDQAPQWTILLPPLPLIVAADDIVVDDLGTRYQVNAAEQNAGGVRLVCQQLEH